jgi:CRISPR-associated protein Cmr5
MSGATQQSRQRSLEQKRAARAWQCVQAVKGTSWASAYGQLARSVPALVQVNGLGQALAFLRAKGKKGDNEHARLAADISRWVSMQLLRDERDDLIPWITRQATAAEYRRATAEALTFLVWLRRFAEAELDGGER